MLDTASGIRRRLGSHIIPLFAEQYEGPPQANGNLLVSLLEKFSMRPVVEILLGRQARVESDLAVWKTILLHGKVFPDRVLRSVLYQSKRKDTQSKGSAPSSLLDGVSRGPADLRRDPKVAVHTVKKTSAPGRDR